MKTAVIIFIFCLLNLSAFFNSLHAGNLEGNSKKKTSDNLPDSAKIEESNKVAFGLKSGMNLSNMNFNKGYHPDVDHINPAWKVGFLIGAAIQIPLPRRFSLTQEYLFSRTKGQYTPSEIRYTLSYFSMPLFLTYSFSERFSIMSGPQFELLITGKEDNGGQEDDITKSTEERSVGWAFGVQYSINSQFFLEARFMHGINAIGINQRSDINEFRFELFQISGNYVFK